MTAGEAGPYLAREHIRRMISTNAPIFSSAVRNLRLTDAVVLRLWSPGHLYAAILHREPMLLCKFRSTAGGDIAQDSMKKRSNFLFGDPGCNS